MAKKINLSKMLQNAPTKKVEQKPTPAKKENRVDDVVKKIHQPDKKYKRTSIDMSEDMHYEIKLMATQRKMKIRDLIIEYLQEGLQKDQK